jgi:glycosyltransferase involved in cell wall biosynthesis
MKIYYCGIERLVARYSLQLEDWNTAVFKRRGIDYEIVYGEDLTGDQIVTGSVLDAHGRSFYSLTQIAALVKLMKAGKITKDDVIFFEDGFTPGMESLFYIIDQTPKKYRPKIYVRFLAQSMDPDDFVNRTGMFDWMRPFEKMLDARVDGILLASEEFVSHLRIAGFKAPIYVTGLPFGKDEVRSRVPHILPVPNRTKRVAFAARFDDEKQPEFYMRLAQEYYKTNPDVEFAVFSGHPKLKSNNKAHLEFAKYLENSGTANFKVYTGLQKNDYYELLADSWVLFNCALQDWWSNTCSEQIALGGITLYPAYRSFPETFANNADILYVPWSMEDAIQKLQKMFKDPCKYNLTALADYADKAIDRTIDIFEGHGQEYSRNTLDYRKHVGVAKYSWK